MPFPRVLVQSECNSMTGVWTHNISHYAMETPTPITFETNSTTTPCQSGPEINGNEEVTLH